MPKIPIGVLIYTHERVDDAKVNMDIIRSLWQGSELFSHITVVHAYNGQRNWYPKRYREDALVRTKNHGHFRGAAELMDAGLATFARRYQKIQYLVVLAADTWCVKPTYLRQLIDQMQRDQKTWATCPWGLPVRYRKTDVGMATDFQIIDLHWARRYGFFPLRYQAFWSRFHELISYLHPGANVFVERLTLARFHDACFRQHSDNVRRKNLAEGQMLLMKERIPVHRGIDSDGYWIRKFSWPRIGLITHHQPGRKRQLLAKVRNLSGTASRTLLTSKRLDYYNRSGTLRTSYD